MAKKIQAYIKLQVKAAQANPSPPVGPALGQHGVNIMEFCKAFNAKTQGMEPGLPTPVIITVYSDRSFTFETKSTPASVLLKKAAGITSGSARPNSQKVGTVTRAQLEDIAKTKQADLTAADLDAAVRTIAGSARSMGLNVEDAAKLLAELSTIKFKESVDISINLGVDPRKSDQVVRGATVLPNGTGKSVRVAVFTQGPGAEAALAAGADRVGMDELAAEMKGGDLNYDVVIASPDAMRVVGQLGQILGPRGLMPNPKVGTVTPDVATAVKNAKAGQVRFRTDKNGIIHASVGKIDFEPVKLKQNVEALLVDLKRLKPSTSKAGAPAAQVLGSLPGGGYPRPHQNAVRPRLDEPVTSRSEPVAIKLEDKKAIVAEVNEAAKAALSAVVADARGVTVGAMTGLRKEAREAGVYVKVVRNTLARRAVEGTSFEVLGDVFKGPTLIAFSNEHPGAAARIFKEFSKGQDKFEIKAAAFEGKLIAANQIDVLATLPTYDEAVSQLMSVIQGATSKLARTLAAIRDQKESAAA
ncbi:hypothetical protein Lal_00008617 [Lupinus albus]|nr:hypothetical protein Lal_00008617 [Lupinus albus]